MKRFTLYLLTLALATLACGFGTPVPTLDIHAVETIAAGTLTAVAPTQSPPTLAPLPTLTLVPSPTPFPPLPPVSSEPARIQFAPGGISATVSNTVTFPNRLQYILRAMQGQQMTVSISSAGNAANFAIQGVTDGQPLKRLENEDRVWTGLLPSTQDYLIIVAVPNGSAAFTFTVTIVWP
jgi:hypothetical protein